MSKPKRLKSANNSIINKTMPLITSVYIYIYIYVYIYIYTHTITHTQEVGGLKCSFVEICYCIKNGTLSFHERSFSSIT